MRIEEAQKVAGTIPCACSDCGMNEPRATEMIMQYAKNYAYEMLQRYTEFLQKEGYIDTDATQEHPTAIEMFLKKDNLKR